MSPNAAPLLSLTLSVSKRKRAAEAARIYPQQSVTQIPDIFDRLIVAEALALKAPLLTRDAEIIASKVVSVIW